LQDQGRVHSLRNNLIVKPNQGETDATNTMLWVSRTMGQDVFFKLSALFADYLARWFAAKTTEAIFGI
jgi:hypothetical protein